MMLTPNFSKTTLLLATTMLALNRTSISTSTSKLKVGVYEIPTNYDTEPMVTRGNNLSMHYTDTIDKSSETGEKGK